MSKRTCAFLNGAAITLVGWAFFIWSLPLGLIYCGLVFAYAACMDKKITPEALADAWLECADRETTEHEKTRATQIALLVLKKLKGRRA